ncbi:unnamed protein product [Symbiodinium sp. CCMP2456]|nr:unnamed protein product [Symbiodinium sp. CCMP2456]
MLKLPSIFKKYSGLEAEVYWKACRKYNEAPEIDLSRFGIVEESSEMPQAVPSRGYAKKASAPPPRNGSDKQRRCNSDILSNFGAVKERQ